MKTYRPLLLVFLVVACSGDSPTEPAAPAGMDVSGTWTGTRALGRAEPDGNCISTFWNQGAAGGGEQLDMTVTQTGTDLTATVRGSNSGNCSYTGSIAGTRIALTLTGCSRRTMDFVNCPNANNARGTITAGTITTDLMGTQLAGTHTFVFAGTDLVTGTSLPSITLSSTVSLSRQ